MEYIVLANIVKTGSYESDVEVYNVLLGFISNDNYNDALVEGEQMFNRYMNAYYEYSDELSRFYIKPKTEWVNS